MSGKALKTILAMTAVFCCLAVMVNGHDFNNLTKEQMEQLKEKLSKANCSVTTNKTEEANIIGSCITNVTGNTTQVPVEIPDRLEFIKNLKLNATQLKDIESCGYAAYKWDQIWTQDKAKDFIEHNITYANNAVRMLFDGIGCSLDDVSFET